MWVSLFLCTLHLMLEMNNVILCEKKDGDWYIYQ